ncbi:bifunctional phosphatase IMPL2, chloroplastic [Beta vulgaris subsp. vulgaris]|uniref:bifunctional phosphatase IMPL2, chloroplastic n=1 Tax=Beta vulgaris subsp. vulgaris TaxID=3555 RepID=UPI002036CC0E|nr:bifunctional phosphatase IMPL2, chloroplastic [Beta vulgaris subsp. vulgaris]
MCDLCKPLALANHDVDIKHELLDDFIRVANEAADAAGDVVKQFFGKPHLIQTFDKCDEDGCIVEQATSADIAAEDAMISVILRNFPNHLVFGEERGWFPEARNADYVWVLDPIDGTTSFKNGVPLFGTLIALLYKSKPILGIIDQPILQRRWVGVHGRRTTMDGRPVQTRPCHHLSRATLYASSPFHFSDEEQEAFHRVTAKVQEPMFGAECFTYGLLASGFVDVVVQSFLGPYDFLAFIPIIEGAGGIVTDWDGQKLQWEASPDFTAPTYYRIIAAGDDRVHQDALEYLRII